MLIIEPNDLKSDSLIHVANNLAPTNKWSLSFSASHWFPYVKKRILVIDQEQFELSAIQVSC